MTEQQLKQTLRMMLDDPFAGRGLTDVEAEAASLAARGYTARQIAGLTKTAQTTIVQRIKRATEKMNCDKNDLPRLLIEQIEALTH